MDDVLATVPLFAALDEATGELLATALTTRAVEIA